MEIRQAPLMSFLHSGKTIPHSGRGRAVFVNGRFIARENPYQCQQAGGKRCPPAKQNIPAAKFA